MYLCVCILDMIGSINRNEKQWADQFVCLYVCMCVYLYLFVFVCLYI